MVVKALKEGHQIQKRMNALQFRLDVFEEFFQLNTSPLSQPSPRPTTYQSILIELEKKYDDGELEVNAIDKINEMRGVYIEVLYNRYRHCASCEFMVDCGTLNFPKKERSVYRCVACDAVICHKWQCRHYGEEEEDGSIPVIGCVACMGEKSYHFSPACEEDEDYT